MHGLVPKGPSDVPPCSFLGLGLRQTHLNMVMVIGNDESTLRLRAGPCGQPMLVLELVALYSFIFANYSLELATVKHG